MEYHIVKPVINTVNHRVFNSMLHKPLGRALVDWLCREINIKKMIDICIERLQNANIKRIYISVNYLKEQIIDFFGDGSRLIFF